MGKQIVTDHIPFISFDVVPNHTFLNEERGINNAPCPITDSVETQITQ